MAESIPFSLVPDGTVQVPIEGVNYKFRTRWSSREERWRLDILTQSEVSILLGLKLSPFINLTDRFADERLPKLGDLYVFDKLPPSTTEPFTFEDLGDRLEVIYIPDSELT